LTDDLADFGVAPAHLIEEHWVGLVLNKGRFLHRRGYRKLWEDMLVLSPKEIPLEIFLSAAESREDAERMCYEFNASVHMRNK
jgi:hypothetical protein